MGDRGAGPDGVFDGLMSWISTFYISQLHPPGRQAMTALFQCMGPCGESRSKPLKRTMIIAWRRIGRVWRQTFLAGVLSSPHRDTLGAGRFPQPKVHSL